MERAKLKPLAIIFLVLMVICIGMGMYKMYAYENPSSDDSMFSFSHSEDDYVNAYVSGDAYNYIINAGLANSYFQLATICAIIAFSILFLEVMNNKKVANASITREEDTDSPS